MKCMNTFSKIGFSNLKLWFYSNLLIRQTTIFDVRYGWLMRNIFRSFCHRFNFVSVSYFDDTFTRTRIEHHSISRCSEFRTKLNKIEIRLFQDESRFVSGVYNVQYYNWSVYPMIMFFKTKESFYKFRFFGKQLLCEKIFKLKNW